MQESYECISRVWLDFPTEFENLPLYENVTKLKNIFEENKLYFDNYITKIIIIGDVSVGKSTLMNSLIGRQYFQTKSEHGTVSIFYCSHTEKDYEYFTINDDSEVKEIDLLMNTLGIIDLSPDNIDHNSIFKVYIKDNKTDLLQKKTALVDCPGLGQAEESDGLINLHCSNSDKIIFLFDYNVPPTPKQRSSIKRIYENFKKSKNSSYLFVYNKCDEINFDDNKLNSLRIEFSELLKEQYHESCKVNENPLFFVSAQYPDMGNDFERLKANLLTHINNNYLRFLKVKAMLFKEINIFKDNLRILIASRKDKKINLSKKLATIEKESNDFNKEYSTLLNYVKDLIVECKNYFQEEHIFKDIIKNVNTYHGTCTKYDAYPFILELAGYIDHKICKYLLDLLNEKYISMINIKIDNMRIRKNYEVIRIENINFGNESNSFMKTNVELNIFWPHENGTKTEKVKTAYINYLKIANIKGEIIENISKIYNDHLLTVQANLKSQKCFITKNKENIRHLIEDCENEENELNLLEDYEKKMLDYIKRYETILTEYIN